MSETAKDFGKSVNGGREEERKSHTFKPPRISQFLFPAVVLLGLVYSGLLLPLCRECKHPACKIRFISFLGFGKSWCEMRRRLEVPTEVCVGVR